MQFSVAFQTDKPLAAYGALAAIVEDYGFDGVSVYNDMLYQPAWLPLLEIARHTHRVQIGPAAVNPFTCHPINIAGNIALIDEASQGRAYLGMARGAWLDFLGIEPANPVTALREAFECVRRLLRRSREPYHGNVFKLAGGDSLRWDIYHSEVPFLLGTWGPKAIHACAAQISEIKIGGTANPAVIPQIRFEADSAAAKAGRRAGEIGIVVGAVTVVDRDGAAARALAKREAALYLPVIAQLDHTLALDSDLLKRVTGAAAEYDFERAASYISDDLLKRLALAGTPDDVVAQALALHEAGATRLEFGTPHGISKEEGLRLLGEAVLPALRRNGL
ncbi:MAG TPA: LLM class flavin-dependent oxidoreductase [Aggregatilineales bacterium]|nr:LLM class flavin-dependent oxidoreductase [Aggregatilineales bacterium]